MILFLITCSCHSDSFDNNNISRKNKIDFTKIDLDSLNILCNISENRDKTIGVLGGSYSIIEGSEIVKDSWSLFLNCTYTDYGMGGFGFSSDQGSIQDEADRCESKDIYVLWASTNDFNNNRPAGKYSDYTWEDNYNERNRKTQCGGINYCIKKLREINPNCIIVFISSSVFFQSEKGYNLEKTNETGRTLAYYVDLQEKCCKINKVAFLNLLDLGIFNEEDYRGDKLHYNKLGYKKLIVPTTVLLSHPQWFQ